MEGKNLTCHTHGFFLILPKSNTAWQIREYNMYSILLIAKYGSIAIVIWKHITPLFNKVSN